MADVTGHRGGAALWLAAAFSLHNMEELLFLPGWTIRAPLPVALPAVRQDQFLIAAGLLTLLMWGLALVHRQRTGAPGRQLLYLAAGALAANALTHLAVSLGTRSYMPGTASGLFLVVPAALWLLWAALGRVGPMLGWIALGVLVAPAASVMALAFARVVAA